MNNLLFDEFIAPATDDKDLSGIMYGLASDGYESSEEWLESLEPEELENIAAVALNKFELWEEALNEMEEADEVLRAILGNYSKDIQLATAKIRKQILIYGLQVASDEFYVYIDNFDSAQHQAELRADEMLEDAWIDSLHS